MSFQLKDEMTTLRIFERSQESIEIKELISKSSISISDLLIENYCDFIHISLARKEKNYSGWSIHDLNDLNEEEMNQIIIGDTLFPHLEKQGTQLVLYHENRFAGALALLKYLFEVFTGPILDATFLTGTTPNPEISQFLIDTFHLNSIRECEKVMMFENGISSKNMIDEILDLATGLKRLDLRCPLPEDWRNSKILKLDKLFSWPSEWFTTNDLLTKLDCECVQLNETSLNCRAFKAFMLKWQISDDTRLKILEISFDGDWEGFDNSGLELKQFDPQERDSHYPDLLGKPDADWFNCEFALDIQRKDGLLASYWRREQSFHFVVWHDRHPIATLQPDPKQIVKLDEYEFMSDEEGEDEDE